MQRHDLFEVMPTAALVAETEVAVSDWIDANESLILDYLRCLVAFRTPNPPAGNESEAQGWIAERLGGLGFDLEMWDVLPGRPNVAGRLRGTTGGPSVALNIHIDVCAEDDFSSWSTHPYTLATSGSHWIGRGSTDAKSAMAGYLGALTALVHCGVRLRGDVLCLSVVGEEAAEPGSVSAIERGHVADFTIVGEPTRARGVVAGIGVLTARISIETGVTAHLQARRDAIVHQPPTTPPNAIEAIARVVLPALAQLEGRWAASRGHPYMPPGCAMINPFRIESGAGAHTPFLLPRRCDLLVSVTHLPGFEPAKVMAEIESAVFAAASADTWLRERQPSVVWLPPECSVQFFPNDVSIDEPATATLLQTIRDVRGIEPEIGGRGAITDAGAYARAGLPVVVFGPGTPHQAHAANEFVDRDDVIAFCKVIAVFLARHCGLSEELRRPEPERERSGGTGV